MSQFVGKENIRRGNNQAIRIHASPSHHLFHSESEITLHGFWLAEIHSELILVDVIDKL